MIKITECAFGEVYDISIKNYFTFRQKNIEDTGTIEKLKSCLTKTDSKIYHIIQEELSKKGFHLDNYGNITQNKT